ncbi:hypothetical protein M3J09_013207 [Ascochyta lentis]
MWLSDSRAMYRCSLHHNCTGPSSNHSQQAVTTSSSLPTTKGLLYIVNNSSHTFSADCLYHLALLMASVMYGGNPMSPSASEDATADIAVCVWKNISNHQHSYTSPSSLSRATS